MKKAIVIYSSKRGSTQQYAEWIAEDLAKDCECTLTTYKDIKAHNLYEYDLIVYGGWIRGSGIVDFDNLSKTLEPELLSKMIIFGCGVANETPDNYMQVWSLNVGKIDPHNECKSVLYILGGRYDPEKVTGFDKALMKVCKKVLTSGKVESAAEETNQMLDRIENGCDLVNCDNLKSLLKDCRKVLDK